MTSLRLAWALAVVAACADPGPDAAGPEDGAPTPTPSTPPEPSSTPPTAPTTPPTTPITEPTVDCSALPALDLPLTYDKITRIQTEEDFDFDQYGHLVAQNGSSLVGYWRDDPSIDVISPNVGLDAAGIRALATGDFIVAQPVGGAVKLVDGMTGGTSNALTGLRFPDGLEVGEDGYAYVTQFDVFSGGLHQFDPYTGQELELLPDSPINGVALSPDELTLYVSSFGYTGSNPFDGVAALSREPGGTWQLPATEIAPVNALIQGLVTDVCGNLYMVVSDTGEVYRWSIATGQLELLADLPTAGYGFYSSARFGAGHGGWLRNELYVTDRTGIYVLDVGIDGRHILAE